jgi:hypothetical protein
LRDQFMIWHPNRLIGLLLYGVFLALVVVGVVTMVRRSNASSRWRCFRDRTVCEA